MPEIQLVFLKPWKRSLHQSLGPDMYFQRAGSGAVQTRLRNQNHLKFIDPELKLTLALLPWSWSRNRNHQSILLEDGVKVATGILPRSRSCIRANICKPPIRSRHQRLSRFWCRLHPRSKTSQLPYPFLMQ